MLAALRARQPGEPLRRVLWWHCLHFLCFLWMTLCYRHRFWGHHHIPRYGPVLLVSNHQSLFDPILVGLGSHHRQFFAMARSTLFAHRVFAWLIRSLNAIPIARGTSDLRALRMCIDVLTREQAMLVFPEGTRTRDGAAGVFKTGVMLLVKRARPRVVPVAIEGAFSAWPHGRQLPRATGRIAVMYGEPIEADTLIAMGEAAALVHLHDTIEAMRQELSRRLRR